MTEQADNRQQANAKEWLRRVALMVGFPVVCLVAAEYLLWVFDVAPPPNETPSASTTYGSHDSDLLDQKLQGGTRPRLICLGGSTVAGAPFEQRMSMCTAMAGALGPKVELVNLAGSALDSNDVLAHAKVACRHPQAFIYIYSGHNEFLNLKRYAFMKPPQLASDTAVFLKRFRFYRVLVEYLRPKGQSDLGVPELTDSQVYERYEENLRHLLEVCKDQKVLVSTVIANPDLGFRAGGLSLRETWRKHRGFATVPMGQSCRRCYRAGPQINQIIRKVADEKSVPVVETTDLQQKGQGFEMFWDHCHPKPAIHLEMARRTLAVAKKNKYVEGYGAVGHNLSAEELQDTEVERAIYLLQWDPVASLRLLDGLTFTPRDEFGVALTYGIGGFVMDDLTRMRRGLSQAVEALQAPHRRRYFEQWLQGKAARNRYPYWVRGDLLDDTEKQELVQHSQALGDTLLTRLIQAL